MITIDILKKICPSTPINTLLKYVDVLNVEMDAACISTPLRICHFLAQIAHESGGFRYTEEIASGSAYEGRIDLGNTSQGDGVKFKGRGLIQVTGRSNYTACSKFLFGDNRLLINPSLLTSPAMAVKSAVWFWISRGLNDCADNDNVLLISKRINGISRKTGLPNGYADRCEKLKTLKTVI
jgi:putative chitinase